MELFTKATPSIDPNTPPANGRCLLLALPAELHLKIWEFAYVPSPRALIFRHDIPNNRSTKCRLFSVALDKAYLSDTFSTHRDAMALRLVCRQTHSETKSMRLNLDTLTFVSNVWHDSRFAIQHFATLLDMCFGYAFGQVRVVTIQCEFLRYLMKERTEKYPDKIFEAAPRVFTQRLPDTVDTFLYFNQQTTLRIVLPELSNSQPVQNKLFAGYWIAVGLRGRNAPVPTSWIFHTARHALERPLTMARWNLPNIKFVTPTRDTWEEEEGHFRAWMKDMAPATFEFWMREAESWYEEGV